MSYWNARQGALRNRIVRKRERIARMGRERTNIVERWSETESEGERATLWGEH